MSRQVLSIPFKVNDRITAWAALLIHHRELGLGRVLNVSNDDPNLLILDREGKALRCCVLYSDLEFESQPDKYDLIVCWKREWKENPLPVLVLSQYVQTDGFPEGHLIEWKSKNLSQEGKVLDVKNGVFNETYRDKKSKDSVVLKLQIKGNLWNKLAAIKELGNNASFEDVISELVEVYRTYGKDVRLLDQIDPDRDLRKLTPKGQVWFSGMKEHWLQYLKGGYESLIKDVDKFMGEAEEEEAP